MSASLPWAAEGRDPVLGHLCVGTRPAEEGKRKRGSLLPLFTRPCARAAGDCDDTRQGHPAPAARLWAPRGAYRHVPAGELAKCDRSQWPLPGLKGRAGVLLLPEEDADMRPPVYPADRRRRVGDGSAPAVRLCVPTADRVWRPTCRPDNRLEGPRMVDSRSRVSPQGRLMRVVDRLALPSRIPGQPTRSLWPCMLV